MKWLIDDGEGERPDDEMGEGDNGSGDGDYEAEDEEEDDAGEEDEEDEEEGDQAVGDDSKESERGDAAMHAKKGLLCVPIGANFTVRGTEFQRTHTKRAVCMRCKHPFVPKAYGKQIIAHAERCARNAREKEAREAARAQAKSDAQDPEVKNRDWIGQRNTVTEIVDGEAVAVEFEILIIGELVVIVFASACSNSFRRCPS